MYFIKENLQLNNSISTQTVASNLKVAKRIDLHTKRTRPHDAGYIALHCRLVEPTVWQSWCAAILTSSRVPRRFDQKLRYIFKNMKPRYTMDLELDLESWLRKWIKLSRKRVRFTEYLWWDNWSEIKSWLKNNHKYLLTRRMQHH